MTWPLTDGALGMFGPEGRWRERLRRIFDINAEIRQAEARGQEGYIDLLIREKQRRDREIWGDRSGGRHGR